MDDNKKPVNVEAYYLNELDLVNKRKKFLGDLKKWSNSKGISEEEKRMKFGYIKIATELYYPVEVLRKIMKAANEREISRIMKTAMLEFEYGEYEEMSNAC